MARFGNVFVISSVSIADKANSDDFTCDLTLTGIITFLRLLFNLLKGSRFELARNRQRLESLSPQRGTFDRIPQHGGTQVKVRICLLVNCFVQANSS